MRYFGGKARICHHIVAIMPPHDTYVEPFGGAASVLLAKPRCREEVYNDLNEDVTNVFVVMRDRFEELEWWCMHTPFSELVHEKAWEKYEDPVARAGMSIFRSFASFGAIGDSHKTSGFRRGRDQHSVPAMDWKRWIEQMEFYRNRLQGVIIRCRPSLFILESYESARQALFYVDPPYVHDTRSKHYRYDFDMEDKDHRKLAKALHSTKQMVMLSGYPSQLYEELYGDWNFIDIQTMDTAKKFRTERLWFNDKAWSRRPGGNQTKMF